MMLETRKISTDDGVNLHVQIEGPATAPLVMASNSLGTDLTMWDGLASHLAGKVRLIRYDKRGHGQSSLPSEAETSIERLGRDVLTILDQLEIERLRYCGLSIGGMIGMWLGQYAPERASCLALCNTAAYVGGPDAWNERIRTVQTGGMEALTEIIIERWFSAAFRNPPNRKIESVRQMLLGTSPEGYCACCAAVRDMDLRAGLGNIVLPALIVTGSEDPATPPALGEAVAGGIPHARLVELQGAAHLSNIEKSDDFNAVVGAFLLGDGRS